MKKALITIGIFLLIIGTFLGGGYLFAVHLINTHTYTPLDATATEEDAIVFEIEEGMLSADVVARLHEAGLIRHEWIANQLVRWNRWDGIVAGEYELHPGLSLYEMFTHFMAGGTISEGLVYIIVPEGARLTWIAHLFAEALDMDANALLTLWADEAFLNELIEEYWFLTDEVLNSALYYPLEGYITPIRHEIPAGLEDPRAVTRVALKMTEHRLDSVRSKIEAQALTFHEILTFAAIIEAETQDVAEMTMVAGVFQNRLDIGKLLQTDVTAQYTAPERQTHVTYEMLEVESPFNTYMHPGLPPGPVNSPSIQAISASMAPASHDYLFFISDMFGCVGEPGNKNYFTNYEDHSAFRRAYLEPSYAARESVCNPNVQVN